MSRLEYSTIVAVKFEDTLRCSWGESSSLRDKQVVVYIYELGAVVVCKLLELSPRTFIFWKVHEICVVKLIAYQNTFVHEEIASNIQRLLPESTKTVDDKCYYLIFMHSREVVFLPL